MSTTRISQLPELPSISANTSNTLFLGVDMPTGTTGKFTATTLAQQLYANNTLAVGNNLIIFSNTIAQFSGYDESFLQVNMQNFRSNGSGDFVVTGDKGTNSNNYINLGLNGSEFEDVEATALLANDGYLYVHGTGVTNQGNLVIGAVSTGTETRFVAGGSNTEHIVAKISESGLTFENGQGIIFEDGTTLSSNSELITTTILSSANTWLQANDLTTLTVAEGYTDTANTKMKSYVDTTVSTANTSLKSYSDNKFLANTSGTFGGDLTIAGQTNAQSVNTGNLIVVGTTSVSGTANLSGKLNVTGAVTMNATLVLSNSNFTATESAVTIKATANTQTPSNDGYMLHISGKQDVPSRIVFDSFGANTYGLIAGRTARGTVDAPQAVQSGDILMRVSGNGWGTTGFAPLGIARIDIVATETYTDAHRGSQIKFYNIPNGSNTLTNIATFNGDSAIFTGIVNPQKGMVLSPNVISGITNTLNIDIANNSLYKITIDNTATINLSGYQTGKIVELWITNSSGSNRVVTHGCTALNSTVNSTTFTIPATSSAFLKYFSIDGDNANTFVSITHA